MRGAIYARVSTDDKGQDPENQLRELRAWAANTQSAANMSIMKAVGRARKSESNLQRCLRTPRSGNSIAFFSGH